MKLSLKELGERIDAHLRRFEADPKVNTIRGGLKRFYGAGSRYCGGSKLFVRYISYQDGSQLTRDEATRYLAWLDTGHVGRHHEALRK